MNIILTLFFIIILIVGGYIAYTFISGMSPDKMLGNIAGGAIGAIGGIGGKAIGAIGGIGGKAIGGIGGKSTKLTTVPQWVIDGQK
jgi:hypothetical protein